MRSPFQPKPHRSLVCSSALFATLFAAGCVDHSIQTTSGKAYVEKHKPVTRLTPETHLTEASKPAAYGAITFDQALR